MTNIAGDKNMPMFMKNMTKFGNKIIYESIMPI